MRRDDTQPSEAQDSELQKSSEHGTRFRKGVSGNPGGRPRKERDFRRLLQAELDEVVIVRENDRQRKLTKRELIVKKLCNDAATGNLKAIEAVFRHAGSPIEETDLIDVDVEVLVSILRRHMNEGQRASLA